MDGTTGYRNKIDPSQEEYDLDEWPFYHLVKLTAAYHQKMDAALKSMELDVPRWRVLNILARRPHATVTEISVEAVAKMSTVAKIIQRMTMQGLVETRASTEDARATEVLLTDLGREKLHTALNRAGAVARQAFYGVEDTEIQTVNQICRKIYGNLLP
ncbi:MarR family winged helix-turn-helix transcriptional regulator [Mesorhizobium sp. ASY16-5R]|uniref:MarR family winged helix-turn-helix transcriptional regulator n=1 Tax=Mesorhizobium sp. ASY16-5R TaxID=3445772 RepID=UPI003FA1009D